MGEEPIKAFDDDLSTKWLADALSSPDVNLDFEFTSPVKVTEYRLTNVLEAGFECRDPRNWELQGSTGGGSYTTLDSRADVLFSTSQQETKEFLVATGSQSSYDRYRLAITGSRGFNTKFDCNDIQLAELEYFGN
jgi:hypothetical protein